MQIQELKLRGVDGRGSGCGRCADFLLRGSARRGAFKTHSPFLLCAVSLPLQLADCAVLALLDYRT
eukprot:6187214-Pleurochrysis_carterae.AAC.1